MKQFWLVLFAVLLSGCAQIQTPLDEGYRFGDTTGSLLDWQQVYCEESDLRRRAVLLALAMQSGLSLPNNGICTDPLEVLDGRQDFERFGTPMGSSQD